MSSLLTQPIYFHADCTLVVILFLCVACNIYCFTSSVHTILYCMKGKPMRVMHLTYALIRKFGVGVRLTVMKDV